MEKHWLEKEFEIDKKEKDNTRKCHKCGKYLEYVSLGYLRYGFRCNNVYCNNPLNRDNYG